MLTIHASCVAMAGGAVLLRGPSGAGKSDFALRLIDAGALLVADDRTCLQRRGDALFASAPEAIRGLLEVRGVGPIRVAYAAATRLHLVIDLVPPDLVPRLPDARHETLLEIPLPCLMLNPFEASAATKAKLALQHAMDGRLFTPEEAHAPLPLQARQA